MRHFFSIRLKIFWYIFAFMIIPIFALTYLSNQVSTKSLLEQIRVNDLQTIDLLQESTNTLLDSVEALGNILAKNTDVIAFFEESLKGNDINFSVIANQYLPYYDSLKGMSLVNHEGLFIGEEAHDKNQLSLSFTKQFFRNVQEDGEMWTFPHMITDIKTKEPALVISYIKPIYHQSDLLGYIILYLDRSRLDQMLSKLPDTVYIITQADANSKKSGQDGTIVSDKTYSNNKSDLYTTSFYSNSKINYNYLVNNSSIITDVNGQKVTITSMKYPRMDWIYLIVSPFSNISQNVLSHLSFIFVIGAASVLFALISAFFIARTTTRPIYSLNRTIEKVTKGNLDIRHTDITNDEIGILAKAINTLLDRIQELLTDISNQQQMKRSLQLQLIQAQVKPHFLYNVLEMISSFIREHMDAYALDSISHLASFYRISLSDGSDVITIKKEMEMIKNYLDLQHLRYIEFMDFSLEIAEDILMYQIPKLTLQPIVENAIYHGLKMTGEQGILRVTGYLKEDRIVFEIYDNGVGMSDDIIDSVMNSLEEEGITKDFGIGSVIKRLSIHFDKQADLEIQSEFGSYTNFILSFPAMKL